MFRWVALISAVLLVVSIAGVVLSPSPFNRYDKTAEHTGEDAITTQDKTLWDKWFPDTLSLYTLALVVFTAVLAFGGLYQLKFLERAEKISAQASSAAKESADAAKKSVELSDRISALQLRAYVFTGDQKISSVAVGNRPYADISIKNSGLTPASKVTGWAGITVTKYPLDRELRQADDNFMKTASRRIVAPGGEFKMNPIWDETITREQMAALSDGSAAIFIWGEIKYIDIFGQDHATKFRSFYGGETGLRGDGMTTADIEGNEAY